MFAGRNVYITPNAPEYKALPTQLNSKAKLEAFVKQMDGSLYQNPTAAVDFIVAGSAKPQRVKNIIKAGDRDVYKPQWLVECFNAGAVLDPEVKCVEGCGQAPEAVWYVCVGCSLVPSGQVLGLPV